MFGDEAAIAWAGRRDVAQKIFSRLRRDQIGPNDIEEQLNEHFGALPFYKQEQTSFQGIICNNGWSKKHKNTILFSTRHDCVVADEDRLAFASGSGAQKFCTKLQHYWKNDPDEIGSETLPALENNVAMLFAAFSCSVDEFYQGVDQEDTFGGAFEIAFSQRTTDNSRGYISKLNNTGYIFWYFEPKSHGFSLTLVGRSVFQHLYKDSLIVVSEPVNNDPGALVDITEIIPPGGVPHSELGNDIPWADWEAERTMHALIMPPGYHPHTHVLYFPKTHFAMKRSRKSGLFLGFSTVALSYLKELADRVKSGSKAP